MMRHAVLSLECGSFVFADGAEISVSEVRFVGRDRLVRLEGVHSLEALEAQVDVWYREGQYPKAKKMKAEIYHLIAPDRYLVPGSYVVRFYRGEPEFPDLAEKEENLRHYHNILALILAG